MAHNHEVPGSSPGPATKKKTPPKGEVFFLVGLPRLELGRVVQGLSPTPTSNFEIIVRNPLAVE